MRVVLVAVSSARAMSGVTRHAVNVARALLLNAAIEHVHVVAGAWQHYLHDALEPDPRLSLELVDIKRSVWSRNYWYVVGLPRIVREQHAAIVHLAFPSPLFRHALAVPTVVTLHDLYPYDLPENFGNFKALFNRIVLRQCLASVDAIACVSHSTLQRLYECDRNAPMRFSRVIPNCVEPSAAFAAPPPGLVEHNEFLLSIAQHRRNKNILFLLTVYLRLLEKRLISRSMKLVIVGIDGPETIAIKSFITKNVLRDRVILLSALPEGQLRWCYAHCQALLAPSTVEGFGLPVAEGMLAGCHVVCSDIPALREVGGAQCHYVQLGSGAVELFANKTAQVIRLPRPLAVNLPEHSLAHISPLYVDLYVAAMRRLPLTVERQAVPEVAVFVEKVER